MPDAQKTLECEALLRGPPELHAELVSSLAQSYVSRGTIDSHSYTAPSGETNNSAILRRSSRTVNGFTM